MKYRVESTAFVHAPGMFSNIQHCVDTNTNVRWARDLYDAMVGKSIGQSFDYVFSGGAGQRIWRVEVGDAVEFEVPDQVGIQAIANNLDQLRESMADLSLRVRFQLFGTCVPLRRVGRGA